MQTILSNEKMTAITIQPIKLGVYAVKRKRFLEDNYPADYWLMEAKGSLITHCNDVHTQAINMAETLYQELYIKLSKVNREKIVVLRHIEHEVEASIYEKLISKEPARE